MILKGKMRGQRWLVPPRAGRGEHKGLACAEPLGWLRPRLGRRRGVTPPQNNRLERGPRYIHPAGKREAPTPIRSLEYASSR